MHTIRAVTVTGLVLAGALALTGCGDKDTPAATPAPTESSMMGSRSPSPAMSDDGMMMTPSPTPSDDMMMGDSMSPSPTS